MTIAAGVLMLTLFLFDILKDLAVEVQFINRNFYLLFFIPLLALCALAVFAARKWPFLLKQNRNVLIVGHVYLYFFIFVSNSVFQPQVNMVNTDKLFLFAFAITSAFFIPEMLTRDFMKKYFQTGYVVACGSIAVYSSFALIGIDLFIGRNRNVFTFESLLIFFLGALWLFPIILEALALYELVFLRLTHMGTTKKHSRRFVWVTTFIVFAAIWSAYLAVYNPAIMSLDSLRMWKEAVHDGRIAYLEFPTLVIFIVRLLTNLIWHPMFVAIVQVLIFAALGAFFCSELYKHGIPLPLLLVFAAIFAADPVNGLMAVSLWSNIPYTMSMLYLTYAVFRLFSPDKGRYVPYINIALALALTSSIRHEGIVPAILCLVSLVILSLCKPFKPKILISAVMGAVLIFLIQEPLYKAITVEHEKSPDGWYVLLDGLQGVVYYGGNLPEETIAFMESFMPLAEWKENYVRMYVNNGAYPDELLALSGTKDFTNQLFKHYLETLKREPFLLIKNRLANSHKIWAIDHLGVGMVPTSTRSDEIGFPHVKNPPEHFITKFVEFVTYKYFPFKLLYYSGIRLILLLILCVFTVTRGQQKMLMLLIPVAGGILSILIALAWNIFRAVWFVPVIYYFAVPLILAKIARDSSPLRVKMIAGSDAD